MSMGAEQFPRLEAATKQRIVKTKESEKTVCAAVISEVYRLVRVF
jgi:hypothetical protein